jgi:hypothetical protein
MPSRPLSADTRAAVKLQTKLDTEAIDVAKGRTDMPAARGPADPARAPRYGRILIVAVGEADTVPVPLVTST